MEYKHTLPIGSKLQSPKRVYTIEQVLGQGGFGITYKVSAKIKVENVTVRTYFAIKEFFMGDSCERDNNNSICYSSPVKDKVEEGKADFYAEAQRLNRISLSHPNLIHVNEVFKANNTVYYVMEYLDGGSLRSYVHKHKTLSEEKALEFMLPIMKAVDVLHQNRMTHLDIKPDNIMLKRDEESGKMIPVLIDFGLAKHYDEQGRPTSQIRNLGCSEGYAPIEQYTGIFTFTPQADVYALAATLLYLLTGRDPVIASDQSEAKISSNLPHTVSENTKNVILGAMKLRKEERIQNVASVIKTLKDNVKNRNPSTGISIITFCKDIEYPYDFPDIFIYYRGQKEFVEHSVYSQVCMEHFHEAIQTIITSDMLPAPRKFQRFEEYLLDYLGNIRYNFSIISYRTTEDYIEILSVIDKYKLKNVRIVQENDLWANGYTDANKDSLFALTSNDGFCVFETGGGVTEIIATGLIRYEEFLTIGGWERYYKNLRESAKPDSSSVVEVEIKNVYASFIVGAMVLYRMINKEFDGVLLQAFPFSIDVCVKTQGQVRNYMNLVEEFCTIPAKKESDVLDCCDNEIELRMGNYQKILDINSILGFRPTSITLTLDIDASHRMHLIVKDVDTGEKKSILLTDFTKSQPLKVKDTHLEHDDHATNKIKKKKSFKDKFWGTFGWNN